MVEDITAVTVGDTNKDSWLGMADVEVTTENGLLDNDKDEQENVIEDSAEGAKHFIAQDDQLSNSGQVS